MGFGIFLFFLVIYECQADQAARSELYKNEIVKRCARNILEPSSLKNMYYSNLLLKHFGVSVTGKENSCSFFAKSLDKMKSEKNLDFESWYYLYNLQNSISCKSQSKELITVASEALSLSKYGNYKDFYYCDLVSSLISKKCLMTVQSSNDNVSKIEKSIHKLLTNLKTGSLHSELTTLINLYTGNQDYVKVKELSGTVIYTIGKVLETQKIRLDEGALNKIAPYLRSKQSCPEIKLGQILALKGLKIQKMSSPLVYFDKLRFAYDSSKKLSVVVDILDGFDMKNLEGVFKTMLTQVKCGKKSYDDIELRENSKHQYVGDLTLRAPEDVVDCSAVIKLLSNDYKYIANDLSVSFIAETGDSSVDGVYATFSVGKQKPINIQFLETAPTVVDVENYENINFNVHTSFDGHLVFTCLNSKHKFGLKGNRFTPDKISFSLNMLTSADSIFRFNSGEYKVEFVPTSDVPIKFRKDWIITKFKVGFIESQTYHASHSSLKSEQPEIKAEPIPVLKQGSAFIALVYSIIIGFAASLMFVGWKMVGVEIDYQSLFVPSKIVFFTSFGSIFVLYFFYWLRLNMFQTINLLVPALIVVFIASRSIASKSMHH